MVNWNCVQCRRFIRRSVNIPLRCPYCDGTAFYATAEKGGDGGSFVEKGDMLIGFVDVAGIEPACSTQTE